MSIQFAVFASGKGTNFQRLCEAEKAGELPELQLAFLFCDKPCGAASIAEDKGIPRLVLRPRDYADKAAFETAVLKELKARDIQLIALAGYMRLLGPTLLQPFQRRVLNIHPSLLPLYPGKDAIARAFRDGVSQSGVSIHLVDEGLDSGPILAQEVVKRTAEMDMAAFEAAIHKAEHQLYPRVLRDYAKGEFQL